MIWNIAGTAILFVFVLAIAVVLCATCDAIECRWRLNRVRKLFELKPAVSEQAFAAAIPEIEPEELIAMRSLLATLLGIPAEKIHSEWDFSAEKHLKCAEPFIYNAFATRYGQATSENQGFIEFPTSPVHNVADLFRAAWKLKVRAGNELE